jgi:regulatory protein
VPVLTDLKPTRRPGRFAVHIDGAFAFSVSEAFAARYGMYRGRHYDDADYDSLKKAASSEAAFAHAYRLLAHRMRSQSEVRRRLSQKGHAPDQVEAVVSRLADEGLVDDLGFARAFVNDKVNLSGWGRERIARELRRSGLSSEIIEEVTAQLEDADEYQRAFAALAAQAPPSQPLDRAHRRADAFLTRRGFAASVVHRAVSDWLAGAPASD